MKEVFPQPGYILGTVVTSKVILAVTHMAEIHLLHSSLHPPIITE